MLIQESEKNYKGNASFHIQDWLEQNAEAIEILTVLASLAP